jgi:hypothetical protein
LDVPAVIRPLAPSNPKKRKRKKIKHQRKELIELWRAREGSKEATSAGKKRGRLVSLNLRIVLFPSLPLIQCRPVSNPIISTSGNSIASCLTEILKRPPTWTHLPTCAQSLKLQGSVDEAECIHFVTEESGIACQFLNSPHPSKPGPSRVSSSIPPASQRPNQKAVDGAQQKPQKQEKGGGGAGREASAQLTELIE